MRQLPAAGAIARQHHGCGAWWLLLPSWPWQFLRPFRCGVYVLAQAGHLMIARACATGCDRWVHVRVHAIMHAGRAWD